jgi:hypothetical protein|tara:strand:- start:111 stop:659 length:549 start_codon:yes stop_codon:yes gene_type:complete
MREDLFAIPLRKYNVDNNEDFITYADETWKEHRFSLPSPFLFNITQLSPNLTQIYTDVIETFLADIGCYDSHTCNIDAMILKVLEKGENSDRLDTLPSHYTMIHYIDVNDNDTSDIFHHPSRSMLNAFRPAMIDEWKEAAGLYINKGDVIIYPSYMEHSTPTKKGSGNRVTITLPLILKPNE